MSSSAASKHCSSAHHASSSAALRLAGFITKSFSCFLSARVETQKGITNPLILCSFCSMFTILPSAVSVSHFGGLTHSVSLFNLRQFRSLVEVGWKHRGQPCRQVEGNLFARDMHCPMLSCLFEQSSLQWGRERSQPWGGQT